MKTVLITGANGFVGKNLIQSLSYLKDIKILEFTRNDNIEKLESCGTVTSTCNCR